jgi:adenosylcobalamin-dependent ribonucleoside-triphosphate reductase
MSVPAPSLRDVFPVTADDHFYLAPGFLSEFEERPVSWGFGDMSYVTYKRTYARPLDPNEPEGLVEEWWQTCRRVVEGSYTAQKTHCRRRGLHWDEDKAQASAQEMYSRMFFFKFLPAGRGLWAMGTEFAFQRGSACLQNCGFISTRNIDIDYAYPFCWAFGMSMLGVGVGFDTRGAGKVIIQRPERSDDTHLIEDSREGWVVALRRILNAFVGKGTLPYAWDASQIREKGAAIKGFGGVASGPAPLVEMLEKLEALYESYVDKFVDSTLIVDTNNIAGNCVVSGGIRRTAQISFGNPDDDAFMDLKQDFEKVKEYRYASNNSIWAEAGMDYSDPARRTAVNGEPGYAWLDHMRRYGRMADPPNDLDSRVMGGNPCLEQSLEDGELCNLVETFPAHHDDFEDFQRTLKFAYLYAKSVTLIPTHDPRTNAIMGRNGRIGCSMSGIWQNIDRIGLSAHLKWCDKGYAFLTELDNIYSEWLCVPCSIKRSSVKPSGTISLLAGATPGIHLGEDEYYIRRIRIADTSPLIGALERAGYPVEEAVQEPNTKVVSFPVHLEGCKKYQRDVTIWEQVSLAAHHQRVWADNQVSCTVKFQRHEQEEIHAVLEHFDHALKGISFLPYMDAQELARQVDENGSPMYHQLPYEPISQETYAEMASTIRAVDLSEAVHEVTARFCDGASCEVSFG